MINQRAFQNLLKRKLSEIQGKRSGYSLRSFAKVLRIGAGPLSQILNGVRNVSEKMAEQILDRLEVSPSERSALYLYSSSEVIPDQAYVIPEDDFKHISSWYHYAIISLTQVKDFDSDPKWIARRLGISENQVQDAVSRLIRLKLLKRTLNHSLKVTQRKAKTIDNIPSESLKKAHLQTLELGKKSLLRDSIEERDFTSTTVPTSPSRIKIAKAYLRRAQEELTEILRDTEEGTEVYRASFQLFPLTKLNSTR